MKIKKLLAPIIIIVVAVVLMAVYATLTNIAQKPTVTSGEFDFSITYELEGETKTINGVYNASFVGNDGYVDLTGRVYTGKIVGSEEGYETSYIIKDDEKCQIILYTGFQPDYMMGDEYTDGNYDSTDPYMFYYDKTGGEDIVSDTMLAQLGAKIVEWDYPEPIENSFVFSHIAGMSSEDVAPLLLVSLVALIVILIVVKKEKDITLASIDVVGIIFNVVLIVVVVPFCTVYGWLSDINGASAALPHQLGYVVPALTVLGVALSIALRRKGYKKTSMFIQFVGPAVFAITLAWLFILEM